jgi:ADP-heptose:LPS heptosyltransferase
LSRSKAYFINGGAGRVVCSIPALEKLAETTDDFIIVCEGGTDFYKGHPTLHKKVYDVWHKGLFEQHLKHRDLITPEPYRVWEYYNQQCSLSQAFDIAINNKGIREVNAPSIVLNKAELMQGAAVIDEVKGVTGFNKAIVLQPFGRGINEKLIDTSSRSFRADDMLAIINMLKTEYAIIVMSEFPIGLHDEPGEPHPVAQPVIPDLRIWAGVIQNADYFIGCDSVGQHIAKALGKPATVVTGSTYPINTSYINDKSFDIIDVGKEKRIYSPIRITAEEEPDRINDKAMDMSKSDIEKIVNSVRTRLGKSIKTVPRAPSQIDNMSNNTCNIHPGGHK